MKLNLFFIEAKTQIIGEISILYYRTKIKDHYQVSFTHHVSFIKKDVVSAAPKVEMVIFAFIPIVETFLI